ncbi:MAG: LuxR C-terminal-related transcriptional regulator [Chloroflexota bacterium]|nr:LuxR C-terminal-related transcriptional regulator [Chloroflexota bacterium]
MEPTTLIYTKLNRPRVVSDLVERPRLVGKMNKGLERKLTVVAAPAGYGKSTLVAEWLETCERPGAWLSLDENDSDLVVYLNYFIAAVQSVFPDAGRETSALLQSPELPPLPVLTGTLINELDHIEQPFILALDDYHLIHDLAVQDLMDELLRHPPRTLHLVLISRLNPPLNLRRLRARGQMVEVRVQDLRFTKAETSAFVQTTMGAPVDQATAALLQEKTEGWVTGLRLSMLSLHGPEDLDQLSIKLPGERLATEYLFQEVFENQPQAIQKRLLRTSILDRFCAPLCEAMCDAEPGSQHIGGQDFLNWLMQADLFVISLDDQRQWYRYHHLFQYLLKARLDKSLDADGIAQLHRSASAWFAQNDLIDEAIHHALAAGDAVVAAELIEQNRRDILNADQWYVLEKWLARLPDEIKQQRPGLLLAQAWVSFFSFKLRAIPPLLESIELLLSDDETDKGSWGEVAFFWGHHWFWQGQTAQSLDLFQRALALIPRSYHQGRGEAEVFWAVASQMSGQKEMVVQTLTNSLYYEQTPQAVRMTRLLGALIHVHFLSGELLLAERVTQQARNAAAESDNTYVKTWTSYMHGYIHYFRNDLEKALHYFESALNGRYFLHTRAAVDSLAGLTLTYQALGQPDKATATMALLLESAQDTNDPAYVAIARSCQARLALLQGDQKSAVRWAQTDDLTTDAGIMFYWLEIPHITQCRVLIAQGTPGSLREAANKLDDYLLAAEATYNTRQMIELLSLQALVYEKQGRTGQALIVLERAVTLAEPDAWIRPFLELEPVMASLLNELGQKGVVQDFIAQIVAAFPLSPPDLPVSGQPRLPEPLTDRELEVLALLARRYRDKEIAAELFISPATVRRHASNIYQKLQVSGRWQAVEKAIALGILPASV